MTNEAPPSDLQIRALVITPITTASISAISSLAVLFMIARNHKKTLRRPYHRIILGLSIMDFIFSTTYCLNLVLFARGTDVICKVRRFFLFSVCGIFLYSAFLSVFFLLTIRFEWKDRAFARKVEPFIHVVAVSYPLTASVVGLLPGIRTGACRDSMQFGHRSEQRYGYLALAPVFLICISVVVVSMGLIFWRVRTQEKIVRERYRVENARKTRRTGIKGLVYIASFLVSYFWILVFAFINFWGSMKTSGKFALFGLSLTFVPLQGFWTFLIYVEGGGKIRRLCSRRGRIRATG